MCAYDIPIEVRHPEQKKALVNGLVAMQAQRVQLATLVEQLNGGYPDPNLSSEIDRLMKIMTAQSDLEAEGSTFRMSVEARGGAAPPSILATLFGDRAAARAIPAHPVLDAETVDDVVSRAERSKPIA